MVTGIDLIKSQIRVAAGEPLPFKQADDRQPRGGDRVPHQRRESRTQFPALPGPDRATASSRAASASASIRTPTPATRVPPYYDSMIGKLIVHQPRGGAIASMQRALGELQSKASNHARCTRKFSPFGVS